MFSHAAPAPDTVEITRQLDPVPVHAERYAESIVHGDPDRLSLREHERSTGNTDGIGSGCDVPLLQDKTESRPLAEHPGTGVGKELQGAPSRRRRRDSSAGDARGCGAARRSHGDAEQQSGHLVPRVAGGISFIVRSRNRRGCRTRHAIHALVGAHVRHQVAVKEPVARSLGRPGHRHPLAPAHGNRHAGQLVLAREHTVVGGVAPRIHPEVESVQVHHVQFVRRVDHVPVRGVAHRQLQAFRVRPRASVDGVELVALQAGRTGGAPARHHEDAIAGGAGRSRRVDHQRAGEFPVRVRRGNA